MSLVAANVLVSVPVTGGVKSVLFFCTVKDRENNQTAGFMRGKCVDFSQHTYEREALKIAILFWLHEWLFR